MVSLGSKGRLRRSPPTRPSRTGTIPSRRRRGWPRSQWSGPGGYSQEWWRRELWKAGAPPGTTLDQFIKAWPTRFLPTADANNIILQARTWERHDVGQTPGFNGDVEKALGSIKVPFLYMPSETDLYFPLTDAQYEKQFMKTVVFAPIHSIWGHPAGAAPNPEDKAFLNETIGRFLAGQTPRR